MGRLVVALSLFAAACGGGATAVSTAPSPSADASVAAPTPSQDAPVVETPTVPVAPLETTDRPEGTVGSTDPDDETRRRPEGPEAPDFVLALGQGGEFSLSGEQKPVYMIFWAEW